MNRALTSGSNNTDGQLLHYSYTRNTVILDKAIVNDWVGKTLLVKKTKNYQCFCDPDVNQ